MLCYCLDHSKATEARTTGLNRPLRAMEAVRNDLEIEGNTRLAFECSVRYGIERYDEERATHRQA